jgi:predicted RNA binding protein YcfA (HicA-like mRNA interferase family)
MKVYNDREIRKILKKNGYVVIRTTGDHNIWEHTVTGDRLSLNYNKVNRMVWQRLVKEHNIDCKF